MSETEIATEIVSAYKHTYICKMGGKNIALNWIEFVAYL